METEEIVIADCAQQFIDDHARTECIGNSSSIMTEIQEHGITSPPEQLWYAAANAVGIPRLATILPQYEIGQYRVDFMINPIGFFVEHPFNIFPDQLLFALSSSLQCLVVEIDGFEWHDKTPEQAERDKTRERFIQQQGFRLFRYAAREVLREPVKCAQEIDAAVIKEIRKACAQMMIRRTTHDAIYNQPFEGVK